MKAQAQAQYNIIVLAIQLGNLDDAWDLLAQFEALFIHSHLSLCNELSEKITAIDPIFNGEKNNE